MTTSIRTALLRLFAAFAAALPLAAQNPTFQADLPTAPCGSKGFLPTDLDGDGDVDLLGSSSATSALNDGAGRMVGGWTATAPVLSESPNYVVADFGLFHALVDLDGDGLLDVINGGAGSPSNGAAWFQGLAAGGFSTTPHYFQANNYWFASVDAGDVDGDGDVDVVALKYLGGTASAAFFRNTGNGAFVDHTAMVGMDPNPAYFYQLTDMDGDGDPDLVLSGYPNGYSGPVVASTRVQENVGGVFGAPVNLTGPVGVSFVAADVDGDGMKDLVKYQSTSVVCYRQTAPFVFAAAVDVPLPPGLPFELKHVVAEDFDGDGIADLALAGVRGVATLRYVAGAWVPLTPDVAGPADGLVAFDADGDGDIDLFVIDTELIDQCNHRMLYNLGGSSFHAAPGPLPVVNTVYQSLVALGDASATSTGGADLLTLHNGKLYRSENDGYSGFGPQTAQTLANSVNGGARLYSGDVDGDGDVDMMLTGHGIGNGTVFLRNDGAAGYAAVVLPAFANDSDAGDLNGDGLTDLLLTSSPSFFNTTVILSAPGSNPVVASGQPSTTTTSGSLGDFDDDGDLDAALTTTAGFGVVWVNNGAGVFSLGPFLNPGTGWSRSADFNGDGKCDVLIGRQLRLRTGPLQFAPPTTITAAYPGTFPKSRPVDVDGDGDVDLVFDNGAGLRNDGPAGFAATTWFTAPANSSVQVAQDLDRDGDLDFVISAGPRILRNRTRQLSARGPLRLGVPEVFEVKGPPGGVALLAVSYGENVPAVATPFGALALDVNSAAIMIVAPLDANGLAVGGAVLNPEVSAGLVGTTYFFQAVVDGDAFGPRLTNAFPLTVLPI
jgi:hypothetical protein